MDAEFFKSFFLLTGLLCLSCFMHLTPCCCKSIWHPPSHCTHVPSPGDLMWLLLFPLKHRQKGWEAVHRLDRTNEVSVCKPLTQPYMNSWRCSPSCLGRGLGVRLQVLHRYCIGNRGNKFCQLMRGHHSGTFMVSGITERQTWHQLAVCAAQGNSWSLKVQVQAV